MHMHDTFYVPRLNQNLMIISQMFLKNYMIVFKNKSFTITNDTNHQVIIIIIIYKNRMYMLKM